MSQEQSHPQISRLGKDLEQNLEADPYSLFLFAMNSPETKEKYVTRLKKFFDYIGLKQNTMEERCKVFVDKSTVEPSTKYSLNSIIHFLQMNKDRVQRKEITGATARNYVKTIKLFCEMNDILIPWKRITKGLPKARRYSEDRAPTIEEIRKITEYPDRRIKAIVYTMSSSGIRLGSWDLLRWKHVSPIKRNEKIIAAKLNVYPGDPEEYFTFITQEAYFELEKWMNYRIQSGEEITGESWILRNVWDNRMGVKRGIISQPKKLESIAVKRIMENALWTQGLRKKLEKGKKRHEFQADHGYRKWFKTRCELAGMKSINIETLMGHSIGISDSYYRATEKELFEDYLKAVDHLTISNDRILEKEITTVLEKSEDNYNSLRSELYSKEKEINFLKENDKKKDQDLTLIKDQVKTIMNSLGDIDDENKTKLAKNLIKNGVYKQNRNRH